MRRLGQYHKLFSPTKAKPRRPPPLGLSFALGGRKNDPTVAFRSARPKLPRPTALPRASVKLDLLVRIAGIGVG